MTTDSKILSSEEMNEILNITQKSKLDLTQIVGNTSSVFSEPNRNFSSKLLSNITDLTWAECRKLFSSFTRRKVIFNSKKAEILTLEDALKDKLEKKVYFITKIIPHNYYSLVVLDTYLLHQLINIIFGGQINENDVATEVPGKVSLLIAEKICQLAFDGFVGACKEYGSISHEAVKIVTVPSLITKIQDTDRLYCMDMEVILGSFESELHVMVDERFFFEYIPRPEAAPLTTDTKNSWKSNIESQVVDSFVTLSVTLPDIKIKLKDFLEMKKESLINISDPTSVYIGLNNLKIYRAKAGQLNDKRVVEIEREI